MTPLLFVAILHFSKTPQNWSGRTRVKKNKQNRAGFSAFSFPWFLFRHNGRFTKWFYKTLGGAAKRQGTPGGFTATNPLCDQTWRPGPCVNTTKGHHKSNSSCFKHGVSRSKSGYLLIQFLSETCADRSQFIHPGLVTNQDSRINQITASFSFLSLKAN